MPQLLERVPGPVDPASGLLRAEHFQMAYVTTDPEQACDLLTRQLGIREFVPLGGPTPEGGTMDARFAWVGTLMYEVIHATGPGSGVFMDRLNGAEGFAIRHHHLGFLVHERAHFDGAIAVAKTNGWDVPWTSSNPLVDACFVQVPGFAHFLEYLLPTDMGMAFFNSVPRT
ncbi:MAG: VOC family protein [Sphingomonadales bacterium]|nr:VOC family protein [Sphingomonadales bacterium]